MSRLLLPEKPYRFGHRSRAVSYGWPTLSDNGRVSLGLRPRQIHLGEDLEVEIGGEAAENGAEENERKEERASHAKV